jgi:hypothetical protein
MQQRTCFVAGLLLLAACGGQSDDLDQPVELTGEPVALDERLLLISGPSRTGYLLDVVSAKPKAAATLVELPYGALRAVRRNGKDHDEALVICAGRRDSAEKRAEPSTLAVIASDGDVRKYELGATPFDTLVQSDDGRYAVLYRDSEAGGRTLQNVNELVVVDLERQPSDDGAVTSKTPEGLAHAFETALISPQLPIAGENRRLLVLLSAAEITLFDLNHIERRGTIVELGEGEGRMPKPTQVLFGENEPVMYVRGDNANDVFVFRLEERTGSATLNDFRPTLNPLGAGQAPRDMALFGAPDAPQVFVVGHSAEARSIDPRSGKTQVVTLPGPADHILMFKGISPKDNTPEKNRALVYGEGSQSLMFVDVDSLRERPDRSLESLQITQPVTSVIEIDQPNAVIRPNTVILTHAQGITLLDLEQRSATPIAANGQLEGALFDGKTSRLWVATKADTWVGTLDLASGETGEVLLDAPVQNLVPFFDAGKLAIVHPSQLGYVTVLDTHEPSRDHARSVRGFFVSGILDRGE